MLRRKPLYPGKNTQNQLHMIISSLGTPDKETLRRIPNDKCRKFIESLPASGGKPLEEMVTNASKDAMDVLNQTLRFAPDRRLTVEQCLEHRYLAQLHCPEDEPVCTPLDLSDFEFERRKIDITALREEIFLEALRYHTSVREQYFEDQIRSGNVYSIGSYRLLAPGESQYTSDEETEGK